MGPLRELKTAYSSTAALIVACLGLAIDGVYFAYEYFEYGPAFFDHLGTMWYEHAVILVTVPIFIIVAYFFGRSRWLFKQQLASEGLLVQQNNSLRVVNAVARAASRSLQVEEAVDAALQEFASAWPFEAGTVALLDKEKDAFVLLAQRGLSEQLVSALKGVSTRVEPYNQLLETGRTVVVKQGPRDSIFAEKPPNGSGEKIFAFVPIKAKDRIVGLLAVSAAVDYRFDEATLETLQTAADEIGMSVENALLYRELEQSEEKHRHILDNVRDAIIRIDPSLKFVFANAVIEQITGYSFSQLKKKTAQDIIAPEYHDMAFGTLERLLQGEELAPIELELVHRAGHRVFVEVSSAIVRDGDRIVAVDCVARDVTERVKSERQIASLKDDLEKAFIGVMTSLATAIDAKDSHTLNHSNRVADYAEALGRVLLTPEEQQTIHYAAHLHDLGKIGVSDAILAKQGALTSKEWDEVKKHPVLGEKILAPFAFFDSIRPIVRHHHERYDGSGYPDGLAGGAIPLGARIIAVADAFEAMISDRPYRKALSKEAAIQELKDKAGSQFDPIVVGLFCRIADGMKTVSNQWEAPRLALVSEE